MKRLSTMFAAVLCVGFASSSVHAGYVALPTTLAALDTPGAYTTNPPLTFASFSSTVPAGFDTSTIHVTSFNAFGETGITFSGPINSSANAASDYSIFYTVTSSAGLITDAYLSSTGSNVSSGGYYSIDETIYDSNGNALGTLSNGTGGLSSERISFAGQTSITVEKDIIVGGLGFAPSEVSIINQGYSFGAVPEPASMALLGIGLTGLLAFRRRFKKASV